MSSARTLLSSTLPVVLQPHDSPPSLAPAHPPSTLTVLLTHSPAQDDLTLTLSDLSTRLLLLRHHLSAALYAPLQKSQALLIDFPAFPAHLCDLLSKVASPAHPQFVATLHLPPTPSPSPATAPAPPAIAPAIAPAPAPAPAPALFRIVQTSPVKSILHLELRLDPAPHDQLVAAVAARAREAELADQRATQLQTRLDVALSKLSAQDHDLDDLRTQLAQAQNLSDQLQQAQQQLQQAQNDAEDTVALQAQVQTLKQERDTAQADVAQLEDARRRLHVDRDDLRRETNRLTRDRDQAASEIARGNAIIDRLNADLTNARAKNRVKSTVIARQEAAVRRLESRVSQLERDARRARDRAALLDVERDGLQQRLDSTLRKLDENAAVLASDQQVIAYLNRELNDRAAAADVGASGLTPRAAPRPPVADVDMGRVPGVS